MSGAGILGIGTSALLTYQQALDVTGHNIANVGTDGYSRQQLDLATRTPLQTGLGSLGTGVQATGVSRSTDAFVQASLTLNTTANAYEQTYSEIASQVDNVLSDSNAGLTPALDKFFSAVQDVGNDPTSTAARQQLLTQGQALVDRFGQLQGTIDDQSKIVNGRIGAAVDTINQLASGIADLNRQIMTAKGGGSPPNDLLDRRDELVRQLAEQVSVHTTEQSDGSVAVSIGQGQGLVVGTQTNKLAARPLGGDPGQLTVGFSDGTTFAPAGDSLGGNLGALLDLKSTLLDPATNGLGRVAVGLAQNFNQVHEAGMDLDGKPGQAFFAVPAPKVLANRGNAAAGAPSLAVTDANALQASDYQLRFDGSAWTVRRVADGKTVGSAAPGGSLSFDGLSLDLSGVTGARAGDGFELQPLRVAGQMQVKISDPRAVAAALPVKAEAAAANTGGASVNALTVTDPTDPALRTPADVTFTGGNFVVGGTTVAPDPTGDTTIGANGWKLVIRGTPAEGDVFQVRDNTGGVGDNRGALALGSLAGQRTLAGGTATLADGYSQVVADVGVKTQRAKLNAGVQTQLLQQAQAQRNSVSGVNLDEEAANMLRFQQAYQAAAQVVATAGKMFDTLLAAVSR